MRAICHAIFSFLFSFFFWAFLVLSLMLSPIRIENLLLKEIYQSDAEWARDEKTEKMGISSKVAN
jgi:hypothetical protein